VADRVYKISQIIEDIDVYKTFWDLDPDLTQEQTALHILGQMITECPVEEFSEYFEHSVQKTVDPPTLTTVWHLQLKFLDKDAEVVHNIQYGSIASM